MKILFSLALTAICAMTFVTNIPAANAAEKPRVKKAPAEHTTFREPEKMPSTQIVEEGSSILSGRFGVGTITYFGFGYEHMFTPNIGAIGDFRYGSYSSSYSFPPYSAEWKYKVWSIAVQGSFHADIFHVQNLDTFLSAGLERTFVSATWSSTNTGSATPTVGADGSAFDFVAYANARYFFSPSWGATVSLGTGLGTLNAGVDYLF